MKKLILTVFLLICVTFTGCTNSATKKLMEETRLAISNGDYQAAITYGELALKDGCNDSEFIALMDILAKYDIALEATKNSDVDLATATLDTITDFEGSGMTVSLNHLREDIEKIKENSKQFDDSISDIQKSLSGEYYYTAADKAKKLLEKDGLTASQRKRTQELLDEAEVGKTRKKASTSTSKPVSTPKPVPTSAPTQSSPKAILSQQEAIDIAKAAMSAPANAKITATLVSDYYQINIVTEIAPDITDECACKVNCYTGQVYDQVG